MKERFQRMKDENCIFCKIVDGRIPSTTVYEDNLFKAILDIAPANKGHVIIIPKNHCANIFEVDEETASKGLIVASKIATAMKDILNCDGINIVQNNGEAAGQTVFHLHIHVIPRYHKDGIDFQWEKVAYEVDEAAKLASQITAAIK